MDEETTLAIGPSRLKEPEGRSTQMRLVFLVTTLFVLIAAACSGTDTEVAAEVEASNTPVDSPGEAAPAASEKPESDGSLTIRSVVNFTGEEAVGTFFVEKGADLLGCETGIFVDEDGPFGIDRVFTCDSGDRSGTIAVRFEPNEVPGQGDLNGPWEVRGATGDFAGLSGGGDFWVTFSNDSGRESFVGDIAFGDPAQTIAVPVLTVPRLNQGGTSCFDGFGTTDGLEEYATVDGELRRLSIATGEVTTHGPPPVECALWLGGEDDGRRIALEPDGKRMWFGPFDGPWEVEIEFDAPMSLVSRSLGANRLVLVPNDGRTVVLLDATTGEQVGEPIKGSFVDGRSFSSTAVNSAGNLVAIGGANPEDTDDNGRVFLVDALTGSIIFQLDVAEALTSMVFAPSQDGSTEQLVVVGLEGMIITIDTATGEVVAEVRTSTPDDAILAVAVRPDGLLVVGSERNAELIDRVSGPTGAMVNLGESGSGRIRADGTIVSISGRFTYEIFDDLAQG